MTRLHDSLAPQWVRPTGLTTADRSTLTTELANDLAGISALQQKVPSDTTCAERGRRRQAMVVDYRVFVVMSPQAHLTIAADTETHGGRRPDRARAQDRGGASPPPSRRARQ